MSSLRSRLLGLAVVVMTAAVFAGARNGTFHFDDFHSIVDNPPLAYATPRQIFTYPQLFSGQSIAMYRPITVLSFALQSRGGQLSPRAMLSVNIALHALAAGLVFALALALARSARVAAAAALIFALHPVQTQAVNYISCRSSLLAAGFAVAAMLPVVVSARPGGRWRPVLGVAAGAVFGLALLSKSEAFGLALIPLIMWRLLRAEDEPRGYAPMAVTFVIVALAYLVARRELGVTTLVPSDPIRPIIPNLATGARAVGAYIILLINPTGLSVIHDLEPSPTLLDPAALPAVILVVVAAAIAIRARGERPLLALGLAWFLLGLAPTTTLVPLRNPVAEHHLYIAMPGLALAAAEALRPLYNKKVGVAALAAALVCWIALDVAATRVWRTEESLWTSAARRAPGSAPVWVNLGVEWYEKGETMKAKGAFERALTLDPERPEALADLGRIYLDLNRTDDGIALLEMALSHNQGVPELHYNLARGYEAKELYHAAEAHYLTAISLEPHYELACENLAGLYIHQLKDADKAQKTLAECLAMEPTPEQLTRIRSLLTEIRNLTPQPP